MQILALQLTLSDKSEFTETNNWWLTYGPSYDGFGRRPFAGRWQGFWDRRSKAFTEADLCQTR